MKFALMSSARSGEPYSREPYLIFPDYAHAHSTATQLTSAKYNHRPNFQLCGIATREISSGAIVSDFIRRVRIIQAKTTATDLLPQKYG